MIGIASLAQKWQRDIAPSLFALLTRVLHGAPNLRIGRRLRADGIPRCIVDRHASIHIGKDVELRRGVELRAHGNGRIEISDGCRLDRGVRILAANDAQVCVGPGTRIGLYSVLNGGASIDVGQKVLLSGFVYLQTSQHRFSQKGIPIRDQGYEHQAVAIGDGAWLAAHVVVMPGITIGENAVIGSNAVVTKSVAPSVVAGGVPAKPLDSSQR